MQIISTHRRQQRQLSRILSDLLALLCLLVIIGSAIVVAGMLY